MRSYNPVEFFQQLCFSLSFPVCCMVDFMIHRPKAWWLFLWVGLAFCVSCGGESPKRVCSNHDDCLAQERCHPTTQVCVKACNSGGDCLFGEQCDATQQVCKPLQCAKGKPVGGKCSCQTSNDCPELSFCKVVPGQAGVCESLCRPGSSGPQQSGCQCPSGWEWVKDRCRMTCSSSMERDKDGRCVLALSQLAPTYWEQGPSGTLRPTCSEGWKRETPDGPCALDLWGKLGPPRAPAQPPRPVLKDVGPQKKCPGAGSDLWDEAYLQRNNLSTQTPKVYVSSAATSDGTGSRQSPFRSLQKAVDAAPSGAVLLIAPGSYAWGLTIRKSLHLVGRCTDGVVISTSRRESKRALDANVSGVVLEGLTVRTDQAQPTYPIELFRGGTVRHLRVVGATGVGMGVAGDSFVMEHCEIQGSRSLSNAAPGRGVDSTARRSVVRYSVFTKNANDALLLRRAQQIVVEGNLIQGNGQHGVSINTAVSVQLKENHVVENGAAGFLVSNVSQDASVSGNLIKGNGARIPNQGLGMGLQLSSASFTVTNNWVLDQTFQGIVLHTLNGASKTVLVKSNYVRNNGTKTTIGRGIDCQKVQSQVKIENNQLLDNSQAGVSVSSGGKVDILGNLIERNGAKQKAGYGVVLNHWSQDVTIRSNTISRNGYLGIYTLNGGDLVVEGNEMEDNSRLAQSAPSSSAGILVTLQKGSLTLQHNRIHKQVDFGVGFIQNSGTAPATIAFNEIHSVTARTKGAEGEGIYIEKVSSPVLIRSNSLHDNELSGIFVNTTSHTVRVEGNVLARNGSFLGPQKKTYAGYSIKLKGLTQSVQVLGNRFQRKEGFALIGSNLKELVVRGNDWFHEGGGVPLTTATAVDLQQEPGSFLGTGNWTIEHNRVHGHFLVGLKAKQVKHLKLEGNQFLGDASMAESQASLGLEIFGIYESVLMKHNTVRHFSLGGTVTRFRPDQGKAHLEGNVWSDNHFLGLDIRRSQGQMLLQRESFEDNAGMHLRFSNNSSRNEVLNSGFSMAKPVSSRYEKVVGRMAGVGLSVGGQGLVRWVFSRAKYSCAAKLSSQDYTLRAVRVPFEQDPCLLRSYYSPAQPSGLRSDEERRMKAACGKCYARTDNKTGCRWIWEDAGVGNSRGQGVWKPKEVVCVDKDLVDTCSRPPSFEQSPVQPQSVIVSLEGQCVKLGSVQDPCGPNKQCPNSQVCVRMVRDAVWGEPKASLVGACANVSTTLAKVCGGASGTVCKAGLACVAQLPLRVPAPVIPSGLQLTNSVFWGNQGPDILLDMAGQVNLNDNLYLSCDASQGQCKPKLGYQRTALSSGGEVSPMWKPVELPKEAAVLWQNPSPFQAPHHSQLEGNDLFRTIRGQPVLWRPSLCESLSSQ